MSATDELIAFVQSTDYSRLPGDVISQAKRCVLDLLGVAILPLVFYHSWQLIAAGIIRSVAPFASGKGEPAG